MPVTHDTATLLGTAAVLHARPHIPQWVMVLSDSQPLRASPSQSLKPLLHTVKHTPPAHEGAPPTLEQAIPQPPQ